MLVLLSALLLLILLFVLVNGYTQIMKRWLGDRWHDFLVLLRLRPDYRNPDHCPPAWPEETRPHKFSRFEGSLVCGKCGGGRLHAIHKVLE